MYISADTLATIIVYCTVSSIVYLLAPVALERIPASLFLLTASIFGLFFSIYRLYDQKKTSSVRDAFRGFLKGKTAIVEPIAVGLFLIFLPNCLVVRSFSHFPVSKTLSFLTLSVVVGFVYQFILAAPFDPAQAIGSFVVIFGPVLSFFPPFVMGCLEGSFWVFVIPLLGVSLAAFLLGVAPFFNSVDPVFCFIAQATSVVMSMVICLISQSFQRIGSCIRCAGWSSWAITILFGLVHLGYGNNLRRDFIASDGYFAQDWFQLGGGIAAIFYGALVFGEVDLYSWLHFVVGAIGFVCMIVAFGVQIGLGWRTGSRLRQLLTKDRRNYQEQVQN
jgi:hypothetical protein